MRSPRKPSKPREGERDLSGKLLAQIAFDAAWPDGVAWAKMPAASLGIWFKIAETLARAVRSGVSGDALARLCFETGAPGTEMIWERLDADNRASKFRIAKAIAAAVRRKDAAAQQKEAA